MFRQTRLPHSLSSTPPLTLSPTLSLPVCLALTHTLQLPASACFSHTLLNLTENSHALMQTLINTWPNANEDTSCSIQLRLSLSHSLHVFLSLSLSQYSLFVARKSLKF